MDISRLLNPACSGPESDQDVFDLYQLISPSSDRKDFIQRDSDPQTSESRKHGNPDSANQLKGLSSSIMDHNHEDSNIYSHPINAGSNSIHAPSSQSGRNYDAHALRKTSRPPFPGEEQSGPTAKLHATDNSREQAPVPGGNKRKYVRKAKASHIDSDEVESTSSSSSSSSVVGPDDSPTQGRTPESPDQRQEGDVDRVEPKFARNADGRFRCTWPRCGKEFTVESRISTHFRIHLGKPPFPCDYPDCNKAFHTSSSLSHHRVVHKDQGLRPYVCRYNRCGATYTQLARLITHQRTTHSASSRQSPDRSSKLLAASSPTLSTGRTRKAQPTEVTADPDREDYRGDDSEDIVQRREAAMTMASLRELATVKDYNYASSSTVNSSLSSGSPLYNIQHHQQQQRYSSAGSIHAESYQVNHTHRQNGPPSPSQYTKYRR